MTERYSGVLERIGGTGFKLHFVDSTCSDTALSWTQVHAAWDADPGFCAIFSKALADVPLDAYFWETPPLDATTIDRPFECVLIAVRALALRPADPTPFAPQFKSSQEAAQESSPESSQQSTQAIAFANVGGDADLVVPCDRHGGGDYAHLAAFLRTAPEDQVREVWRLIAQTAAMRLGRGDRCWISSSGLGVAWLHIRLDSVPKYYSHAPYRLL